MKWHYGLDELSETDWGAILPIIIPFILISLILIVFALIDLYRHRIQRQNVLFWTIVIIFMSTLGPILYFTMGRKEG